MPDDLIRFKCKHCKNTIKAKPKYAGKKISCPGCQQAIRVPSGEAGSGSDHKRKSEKSNNKERGDSTVILRNSPVASEAQKREGKKLGIKFKEDISARELSELIEWEKKNRAQRIKAAKNKLEAMLAELTPMEFMEEMLVRRQTGILLFVDADELGGDMENLPNCTAQIFSTDDLSESDMPAMLQHALAQLHAGQDVPQTRHQYDTGEDED
ncbi:hypothetical protein Pan97_34740 [Bremerella volcania]|uniref:Zinc finger/thioredoxin putative domain-containing protein n=1 Tax=Bremerella volcania TaxID=2527984 RepID=A0A518CB18_9BACT|nr:hypothetical protein [Bremerella volcania]QDU76425.1 hypothetical protein Pan97_34740 [Bremerella volcania]